MLFCETYVYTNSGSLLVAREVLGHIGLYVEAGHNSCLAKITCLFIYQLCLN